MRLDPTSRRPQRLSLTPLIDVIFLLLLFFMLSSTFSRFAEIELTGAGRGAATTAAAPVFVQLRGDDISVNGQPVAFEELQDALQGHTERGAELALISMDDIVTSQRFVDVYGLVRGVERLNLAIVN